MCIRIHICSLTHPSTRAHSLCHVSDLNADVSISKTFAKPLKHVGMQVWLYQIEKFLIFINTCFSDKFNSRSSLCRTNFCCNMVYFRRGPIHRLKARETWMWRERGRVRKRALYLHIYIYIYVYNIYIYVCTL